MEIRSILSSRKTTKRNIVTVDEAMEILDFFAKRHSKYYIATGVTTNKGLWYWISLRAKLPHFNVSLNDSSMVNALPTRFRYLLMSIDEIGMQYYSGTDNDTLENTMYHFNYFITLVTGIFDSLALETRDRYQITFKGDNNPSRISLSNKAGTDFLKEVKIKNPGLREHINKYVNFIKVIYEMRELVIHREGLRKLALSCNNINENWQANVVAITNEMADTISKCADSRELYTPFTKWGFYKIHADESFIEPYRFVKAATKLLSGFTDRYLELLGENNWVETTDKKNILIEDIHLFQKWHLGF